MSTGTKGQSEAVQYTHTHMQYTYVCAPSRVCARIPEMLGINGVGTNLHQRNDYWVLITVE